MKNRAKALLLIVATMTGCAGLGRSCSGCNAKAFGANWVVVQYRFDGEPINCWKLVETSIDNEPHSDGIWWKDPTGSHLVHISGWYNRVQVSGADFKGASEALGVDIDRCKDGRYLTKRDGGS